MRVSYVVMALSVVLLIGCHHSHKGAMVGANNDEHGCKASAGYLWCAQTQKCERPWELSAKEKIDNTHEAFMQFCNAL